MANNYFISRTGRKSTFFEDSDGNIDIKGVSLSYDPATAYTAGMIVEEDGVLYRALSNLEAGTATTDTASWEAVTGKASLEAVDSEFYRIEKGLHVLVLDSENIVRKTKLLGQTVQAYDSDKVYLEGEIVDFDNSLWKAIKPARRNPYNNETLDSEWVQIAGAGGAGGIESYDADKNYKKGDLIISSDIVYAANWDSKAEDRSALTAHATDSDAFHPIVTTLGEFSTGRSYAKGTVVTKDGKIYQAANNNSPLGAGTFTIGVDGDSEAWVELSGSTYIPAEYVEGSILVTAYTNLNTSWLDYATLTVSSTGIWDVMGQIPMRLNAGGVDYRLMKNGGQIWWSGDGDWGGGPLGADLSSVADHRTSNHWWRNLSLEEGDVLTYQIRERNDPVAIMDTIKGQFNARKVAGFVPAVGVEAQILSARSSTLQSNLAANAAIQFENVEKVANVTFNSANGQVTLKGGVTYRLEASAGMNTYNNGTLTSQFYDVTNSQWFGSTENMYGATAALADGAAMGFSTAIITPATDIVVEYRVKSFTGGVYLGATQGGGNDGWPFLQVEAIANLNPAYESLAVNGLTDVTITGTPAEGSLLRTFDGVTWENDTFVFEAANSVGTSIEIATQVPEIAAYWNSSNAQWQWRNKSGGDLIYYSQGMFWDFNGSSSGSSWASRIGTLTNNGLQFFWKDTAINLGGTGDMEEAIIKVAPYASAMGAGNYKEVKLTCTRTLTGVRVQCTRLK